MYQLRNKLWLNLSPSLRQKLYCTKNKCITCIDVDTDPDFADLCDKEKCQLKYVVNKYCASSCCK